MSTSNDPKPAEQAPQPPEAASGSDMGSVLATLDQVFSTFRAQLQDQAPEPLDPAAQLALDTFNEIVAELNFRPLPPTLEIAAKPISSTEIELTWTDDALNADGYRVRRCQGQDCTDFVEVSQLAAAARSFRDTNLSASTTYRYQLVAFNLRGEAPSEPVTVTTKAAGARS